MKKIIKRFFILFLCLTLSIASYTKQRANAVALVDDLVVGGGITVSTGAIVALAGTTLVAGGVYLDSTLNDSNVSRYVVSKMIDTGNALNYWGSKTLESGKQVLTWTSEGLKEFYDVLSSTIESGVPYENVSSGTGSSDVSFTKPGSYTVVYTYDFTYGDYGPQTETKVINNTGGISISFTSSSIHIKDYLSDRVYTGMSSRGITNLAVSSVVLDGNSVCVDVSDSYRNFNDSICSDRVSSTSTSPDNSISYQPSIGVPLNPPLDGGSVGALNPSIDFPYGKTWDDLYPDVSIPKDTDTDIPDVDVPSDTVFDKVIDSIKDLTDSIADSIDKVFDIPVGATPSLDFSPLMIATMKFPFCIPWDLFRCVEVFNSGEETFKYEFKEVKYSDTDIIIIPNFKVDFSTIPYVDTLRKVFKFIMYISYCVFLICKIRGLMRS